MHYLAIAIIEADKDDKEIVEKAWKDKDELTIEALRNIFKRKLENRLNELEESNFDAWGILDVTTAEWMIINFDKLDRFPEAVLTSKDEWLRMPWNANWKKQRELDEEWDKKIMSMLNKYKESGIVVFIDIDS